MPQNLAANQVQAALVRRVIENLVIDGTSNTQVIIRLGSTVGTDDGADIMSVPSDITVDITVSGINGLDSGSESSSSWYYIWLIKNPVTGTIAGLLSTHWYDSPTLPVGYTLKRLIGAVYNNGSSNFERFSQVQNRVQVTAASFVIFSGFFSTGSVAMVVVSPGPPLCWETELTAENVSVSGAGIGTFFIYPGLVEANAPLKVLMIENDFGGGTLAFGEVRSTHNGAGNFTMTSGGTIIGGAIVTVSMNGFILNL
jgi:hypothetical protein